MVEFYWVQTKDSQFHSDSFEKNNTDYMPNNKQDLIWRDQETDAVVGHSDVVINVENDGLIAEVHIKELVESATSQNNEEFDDSQF